MDKVILGHESTRAVARGDPQSALISSEPSKVVFNGENTIAIAVDEPSSATITRYQSSATVRSGLVASRDYNLLRNKPRIGGTEIVGDLALSDIADAGANIEIGTRDIAAPELTAAQVAALLMDD